MNIIIVGCGKVGYTIAKNLAAERDVNITIIDNKPEAFDKSMESIDAMYVKGNGLSVTTLTEAGVREADLLVGVTNADETNILCCITAKHLGVKYTIARIRHPEYALELNRLWRDLGLDMIINPELETAREISRLIRFPTADDIDTFADGRVELVSFRASEASDFFAGKSVAQIFHKKKMGVLLATVERDKTVLIPNGDLIFETQDIIRVLGRPSEITGFFSIIGINTEKIKNTMIVGGSKITYYLMNLLHRYGSRLELKVIDIDKERCEELSESFPRCLIIHGDGTDEDILLSEDIEQTDSVVCLTDRDEENTIIALYSMQIGVRKIILKIDHINRNMVKNLRLGSIVCPKNITSDQIVRFVRGLSNAHGNHIRTMYKIFENDDDSVEAVELTVGGKSKALDTPIKELRLKKGILIGCIVRNANTIVPTGDSSMAVGDTVIVIVKNRYIMEIDDILEE